MWGERGGCCSGVGAQSHLKMSIGICKGETLSSFSCGTGPVSAPHAACGGVGSSGHPSFEPLDQLVWWLCGLEWGRLLSLPCPFRALCLFTYAYVIVRPSNAAHQ